MKAKRSRFIVAVSRNKQLRYGLINLSAVLGFAAIIGFVISFQSTQSMLCDPTAAGDLAMEDSLGELQNIWIVAGLAIAMTAALCFAYIMLLTQKFFGPQVAIVRQIEKMMAGDLTDRVKLREHDELQDIAKRLNEFCDQMYNQKQEAARDRT